VPEVVEAYLGQTGLLEERLVGSIYEVLGVDGCSYGRGEDQSMILVGLGEPQLLLELARAVCLESVHRPGCEVDLAPTTPSLGFAHLCIIADALPNHGSLVSEKTSWRKPNFRELFF
jgi:hypothetical protein